METAVITALDQDGRGIARRDGKVVFVEGALIGETVAIELLRRKQNYDLARAVEIELASPARVEPPCPYFGTCGGCSLQHLDPAAQVAVKQRVLEDALWHIGKLRAAQMLAPIHGPPWGYRHRARMSARYVAKKGGALIGFRERRSTFVVDMASCLVLPQRISALLPELRALVGSLSIRERVPQIELAIGEGADEDGREPLDVLVLRVLEPPSDTDVDALTAFAARHGIQFHLQPRGPDSVRPLAANARKLAYELPEFALRFEFEPTDFTQVNAQMNRVLVRRAIALLEPGPGERIADFFCGLGNFTLPIARRGAQAIGVEGSAALAERAAANAERNGLAARASVAGLHET